MFFSLKKNIKLLIEIVFLFLIITLITSCAQQNKRLPCPEVSILNEGSSRTIFYDGNGNLKEIRYFSPDFN